MKYIILFILININLRYVELTDSKIEPLVLTEQGLVKGLKSENGDYSVFLGVRYAEVNPENPFGPAQPASNISGIFNANETVQCPQIYNENINNENKKQTLDCLRLNIYIPNHSSFYNPLPVMVWIHGGGFDMGSNDFNPSLIVSKGIIVVSINYRLGVYGFMCLDIPSVPGNRGLKDQHEALMWVKRNIKSFGGDPNLVTIGGQSSGSASVLLHLFSNKEKLYKRVIAQSGAPQHTGMFANSDKDAAIKLAKHLGYETNNSHSALDFLKSTPFELITEAGKSVGLNLKPCTEKIFNNIDIFVEKNPFDLFNAEKIYDMPVMIGHTSQESTVSIEMYGNQYLEMDPFDEALENNFNFDLRTRDKIAKNLRHFYLGDANIFADSSLKLSQFNSDFMSHHPISRTITSLIGQKANPVYSYVFSYVGNTDKEFASHGDELNYLFEMAHTVFEDGKSINDTLMIDRITSIWANFVKYGNPTPGITDSIPVIWDPVTIDTRPYLNIDIDMRMENRVNKERTAFWDFFYSVYQNNSLLINN